MGKRSEAVVGVCSRCGETNPARFNATTIAKKGGPCRACILYHSRVCRERQTGKAVVPRKVGVPGVCPQCKTADPALFTPSALKRAGQWCKPCLAEYRRGARAGEYQTTERAQRREWLQQQKAGGCVRCGEKDLACLDFHHQDASTKRMNIGTKLHQVAQRTIEAELKKTIVLCSNCHRKMHYHEKTGAYINAGKKLPGTRPQNTHEARQLRKQQNE